MLLIVQCARSPEPPDVSSYGDLDPDVASLLTEQTAAVNAARSDAGRWGSLGMALEANGLLVHAESAYSTALQLSEREAQWYYRRAVLRARRGADEEALADLDRAIALSPGYAPAHWRRGQWLLDRGDTAEAKAAFDVAAKIAPSDPAGPTGLALVHLAKGENAEAAALLEKLLATTPGDRYALQLLGTAYRRLGREDEARFALIIGSSGQPAWTDPWSDDVSKYRRGFAAMLKEATQLGVERKFDEAIALLNQLTKTRPDDKALRVYLGGMYAAAGKIDQAAAILDPIIAADPTQFDATMHLATGYLFTGNLDTAANYATRALALRPASADAAKLRGMVHWQQGRTREAEALFEAAAAADPRDPMPHLWIGMILGQQARYVDARRRFEVALSKNPLLGDALIGVADTFAATGNWDAAKVALERARQAEPDNPRLAAARDRIFTAAKTAR
ncbi:MAG TPA: tetratricopeptide repeat protein [Vicinamibacterales bacterium]|nr:tetratricopeptide repeat protein [Vicinamibacterales bacterium]